MTLAVYVNPALTTLSDRIAHATTVGARLRIAREVAGLERGQVVRMMPGLHMLHLGAVEGGHATADSMTLERLCDLYGVSTQWVRTGQREPHDLPAGSPDDAVALASILRPKETP